MKKFKHYSVKFQYKKLRHFWTCLRVKFSIFYNIIPPDPGGIFSINLIGDLNAVI
jgi:hypothetical protein